VAEPPPLVDAPARDAVSAPPVTPVSVSKAPAAPDGAAAIAAGASPAAAAPADAIAQFVAQVPDAPPPELRFKRPVRLVQGMRELWSARALITALAERDIRARYKQHVLGAAWVIVTPIMLMLVFTVFIQRVADVPTLGIPYPVFSYVALVPWQFFSASVGNGADSITGNQHVVTKIFCPREVFPLTTVAVAAADMVVSLGVLGIIMAITTTAPTAQAFMAVPLFALQLVFGCALGMGAAAVAVYLRDVRSIIPLILQLMLFATPIAYGMDQIPGEYRWIYSLANPLAPIIDGYRRCILLGQWPQWDLLGLAAISIVVISLVCYWLFKKLETGFADVI
jgi:ABC-type polysaccharide/polyol phosphate export permease